MADRSVKVILTAQAQGFISEMEKAGRATRETGSEAEKLAQKSQAFEQMGRAAMVGGGAVAAGLALSTKAAIDWDSAWAGVTKTVDGTPEQMAALEQELRNLAGTLPATHEEIAGVAEAAGQLGIERENVAAFTKTMIDLGETTNLTAEEAATSLARFMNVMGTSQTEVSALGSALVDLGNNYATTEAEILEMSQRLAGAGTQIGLSEGQVLGLATALSSVGIEAEAGGSAMSKVMIDIASSVDKGGDRVKQFAQVAGMSADEFSQKWRTAPGEALAAFVQGLADAESQGKSTFGILEDLGISEVRMRDALLRSAAASDQFNAAMEQGNAAMVENTALTNEAEKRYETTAAKLDIMRNNIIDAAISLGEHFLPAVEAVADGVGGFADMLSGLDGPMGAVVAWGGALAATGLFGAGLWMTAIPKIAAYKVAIETLGIAGGRTATALRGITTFLGGPWGIALTGAAVVAGALLSEKKKLNESAEELAQTLDLETGAVTDNSKAWAARKLESEGVLEMAGRIGVSAKDITDAYLGEARAIERVNEQLEPYLTKEYTSGRARQMDREVGTARELNRVIEGGNKVLDEAKAKHERLAAATEESTDATEDSVDASEDSERALADLSGQAESTTDEIGRLADAIRGFASYELDAREASRQLEAAYDDLEASIEKNGNSLDITTEAGRANEAALDAIARAALDSAAAIYEQTGSEEQSAAAIAAAREELILKLAQFGITGQAAEDYADKLGLIPKSVDTLVTADTKTAVGNIENVRSLLNRTDGTVARTYVDTIMRQWHAPMKPNGIHMPMGSNADGGFYEYANGGMLEFANGGGWESGIYKGGTPLIKFAEPETRWESFISGKPGQEARNRQIWVATGERLGVMQEIRDALSASANSGGSGIRPGDRVAFEIEGTPLTAVAKRVVSDAGRGISSSALDDRLGVRRF